MSDERAGGDLDVEALAERIAQRGPEALIERLRTAYAEAARTHADIISLDEARIEALVQRSAEHADGLQWRRALANVAAEELGIELPQALSHPAVARAQELVGAPSYEDSLAELLGRPVPSTPDEALAGTGAVSSRPAAESDPLDDASTETETVSEPPEADLDDVLAGAPFGEEPLRVTAIHLGGVANLSGTEQSIDLRLSEEGLDILRGEEEIVGRLAWNEIDDLEVPLVRGRRRQHRRGHIRARLIVHTRHGEALFEIPAFSSDELRQRLDPLVDRFTRG